LAAATIPPLYAWAAETLASLLPQLVRQEIVTAEGVGIDSLEARLREAVVAARSQVVGPEQFCAWASV
jgi:hypothetical protein